MKFFARGVPGEEGAIFICSLLLEIGPSNINTYIFIFIKEFFLNLRVYISENIQRDKQLFKLVKVLVFIRPRRGKSPGWPRETSSSGKDDIQPKTGPI